MSFLELPAGEEGQKRPISRKGGQTLLKHRLLQQPDEKFCTQIQTIIGSSKKRIGSKEGKGSDMHQNKTDAIFCLQLEASCLQWSFLLTIDNFSFFLHLQFELFAYNFSFLLTIGAFCLQWESAIRALRDCKQRNLSEAKQFEP